jgi:YfiR/HmsC-like
MRSSGARRPPRCVAALLAVWIWGSPNLHPQTAKPTEYQVKAAYLRNFAQFVEWPQAASAPAGSAAQGNAPAQGNAAGQPDEPFPICILGQDPFGPALDAALSGETAGRHPLVPRRVANAKDAAAICRVVFIAEDDRDLRKDLAALDKSAVLTVGDHAEFLKRGGMIQFVLEGNRVRFEVNLTAAKRAGLNLSSELLKVAAVVRRLP